MPSALWLVPLLLGWYCSYWDKNICEVLSWVWHGIYSRASSGSRYSIAGPSGWFCELVDQQCGLGFTVAITVAIGVFRKTVHLFTSDRKSDFWCNRDKEVITSFLRADALRSCCYLRVGLVSYAGIYWVRRRILAAPRRQQAQRKTNYFGAKKAVRHWNCGIRSINRVLIETLLEV